MTYSTDIAAATVNDWRCAIHLDDEDSRSEIRHACQMNRTLTLKYKHTMSVVVERSGAKSLQTFFAHIPRYLQKLDICVNA